MCVGVSWFRWPHYVQNEVTSELTHLYAKVNTYLSWLVKGDYLRMSEFTFWRNYSAIELPCINSTTQLQQWQQQQHVHYTVADWRLMDCRRERTCNLPASAQSPTPRKRPTNPIGQHAHRQPDKRQLRTAETALQITAAPLKPLMSQLLLLETMMSHNIAVQYSKCASNRPMLQCLNSPLPSIQKLTF